MNGDAAGDRAPPGAGGRGGSGADRLGVLGTLVLDTIHPPDGRGPRRALGGIVYSLSAWEAAPARGWVVLPLIKVGRDARSRADAYLDRLSTIASRRGVVTVQEPNNRVELRYRADGSRTERLTGGVPEWAWEELAPLARSCDALYVNLIAGWELDLACARRLGDAVSGPLYCDLHSLLLDRRADGVRERRAPDRWREWASCFDYLQMNREELRTLADADGSDPDELARDLVRGRPRAVFVTRGREGAGWYAAEGDGAAAGRAGASPADGGDPTGCGDAWGAACMARLLEGRSPGEAAAAANRIASRNVRLEGGAALLESAARPEDGGAERGP